MKSESALQLPYVEVLVDCPGHTGLLTYRVPAQTPIAPGDILSVDFGARQVGAIAIRLTATAPSDLLPNQIREVAEVVSDSLFPPGYWALLERVADYYYTPLMTATWSRLCIQKLTGSWTLRLVVATGVVYVLSL